MRLRQRHEYFGCDRLLFLQLTAFDGDKRRAKAFDAGKILVARRLINRALAAKFRLHRYHRQAIRFLTAVATAFTHEIVDDDTLGRIGEGAALATTTLLRCTGLVVDEDGAAGQLAQFTLHGIEFVAMTHRHAWREVGRHRILFRLVSHHHNAPDALGVHLLGKLRNIQWAVDRLPTGHCHGVVKQNLVGDIYVGSDGGANCQQPGVEISAVAQISEHMLSFGERRNARPRHALAAHLREGHRLLGPDPGRHVVAANTGERLRAFGHTGGSVVRTAGTKIRNASDLGARTRQCGLFVFDELQARFDDLGRVELANPFSNHARNHGRCQLTRRWQQPLATCSLPFTVFVVLADHTRSDIIAPVIELLF